MVSNVGIDHLSPESTYPVLENAQCIILNVSHLLNATCNLLTVSQRHLYEIIHKHIVAPCQRESDHVPMLQAVGVHCAEGRGRTGVMCACYLIYYYDMEPWDAIRIMRRQRPGSVERKVQEETVVRFYTLLMDYGKESIDSLDQRDKQLMESQRRAQAALIRCHTTRAVNEISRKFLQH